MMLMHSSVDRKPENGKVNLLLVASSLCIGGAETVIRHLAETIDREQFAVTVCHLKERGPIGVELERQGIDIVGISEDAMPKPDYLTFRKLLKVIRQRRIDVVHTHTPHGLVDATICKLFRPGLKVVHTFHFGNYPHTQPRILWMERIFSRLADQLYAVGELQRGRIRETHGLGDSAIRTLRNGVSVAGAAADDSFRNRYAAGDEVLIGTIATLIEQKGLRDLMKVARRVTDLGHRARFVIVGEGQLRGELEALRSELGLEETVSLTGWITNAAAVALPAFDVFFQPSLWEAMSMVLLEAMAAGKPVVATRVGDATHVVDEGLDGLLVDSGDIEGMAQALVRLIGDPALRAQMGQRGRQKVAGHYTIAHMTQAYEQAYLEAAR